MMDSAADVLVVDDDPDLAELVRTMLDISGYAARCARNGLEALEAVAQRQPALILLDMMMPVMDGWQCARELHLRYGGRLPIVVLTAAEHARSRTADLVGVSEVLSKPFEMDELLCVVARYAGKARASRM